MRASLLSLKNSDRGTALITAIGFIAVLSILGTVVLTATTRDLNLSGGFLPSRQAFYTADRTVEYAMNRDLLANLDTDGDSVNLVDDSALDADGNPLPSGLKHGEIIEGTSGGTLVAGTVTRITSIDLLPERLLEKYPDFKGRLYHVEAISTANSSSGPKESRIDASIIGLIPGSSGSVGGTDGTGASTL